LKKQSPETTDFKKLKPRIEKPKTHRATDFTDYTFYIQDPQITETLALKL